MSYEFYLLLACLVLLIILLIRQAALTHRQENARLRQEHDLSWMSWMPSGMNPFPPCRQPTRA